MTPDEFISKWKAVAVGERAAAQSHFIDLCRLLDEPAPTDVDPTGEWYAFEKGATKTTGGEGWADVWKRGHFAWEYKGKRKDLRSAFVQLQQYALALENPPLLVVSDIESFEISTNWTNTVSKTYRFDLDQLHQREVRDTLKAVFSSPDKLKPGKTRQALTEEAAGEFARLAQRLRDQGHAADVVAHFINRLVFCMFAEDVNLLPDKMFRRMLEASLNAPDRFQILARSLFGAMRGGGMIGFEHVDWFNGGLFDDDIALPLQKEDVALALRVADLDWAEIDPSIFGTLFERGLDPDKRSQLGAHYTDREKIKLIVDAVVVEPLTTEWAQVRTSLDTAIKKAASANSQSARTKAQGEAQKQFREFLDYLRDFRVLDPACGSGNFLYLALLALKDLEHKISIEAEALAPHVFPREFPRIGPGSVRGIEVNSYAAELARISIWIGEIQWMQRNGYSVSKDPILKPLQSIECRDALLNEDGTEATWPKADAIIGNPPFLGAKLMNRRLGAEYTRNLRAAYAGRLAGFSDLVCFWFEKSRKALEDRRCNKVGLVATSSIRGGTNRPVLDRITEQFVIYNGRSEVPWTLNGARVEVSIICFCRRDEDVAVVLDGRQVKAINPDLTSGLNVTGAQRLGENKRASFLGIQTSGPLDVDGATARAWLLAPTNPNGLRNGEVLKPYWNGDDVTGRCRDRWLIDLPHCASETVASLFEAPFEYLRAARYDPSSKTDLRTLMEARRGARDDHAAARWWEPYWPRPEMRAALRRCPRYIVTPETSQFRLFVWLRLPVLPDKNLIVIAHSDDTTFGVLHSRFHEAWALRLGTSLEDRPRYTSTTTFETFPFPAGMTPNVDPSAYAHDARAQRIGHAAERLNELRDNWLNPLDLVKRIPEVVPGFPDRILPVDASAAEVLKKRTLTNLYNQRPTWLANAHAELDAAVAAAYGWPEDIGEEEALERLLELNKERSKGS